MKSINIRKAFIPSHPILSPDNIRITQVFLSLIKDVHHSNTVLENDNGEELVTVSANTIEELQVYKDYLYSTLPPKHNYYFIMNYINQVGSFLSTEIKEEREPLYLYYPRDAWEYFISMTNEVEWLIQITK